jgi:Protein of unknown function (DUF2829)
VPFAHHLKGNKMTHSYIGTKEITGWHSERDGVPGYAVKYEDGYTSWSPVEAFEKAYRVCDPGHANLTFGDALYFLKLGKKVARTGWNGKGMWLILVPGAPGVQTREGTPYHSAGIEVTDILPHIDMWTINAQGRRAMLPGWLASQSDMLAEDWMIVG